ncbi:MAG: YhbY family RNA-binding protein [Butyricicoccus pullicaecorum]|nr:YhbY family RNA-binding protein [Butyricicoccus pullicaecorum]
MLTSKQRAFLRKQSNTLAVTLHIGKEGVTEGVISQLEVLLENHELVKGKVLENAMLTPRTVSDALCEATGADGVQCIGTKFVLYRQSSDPDKRKIILEK